MQPLVEAAILLVVIDEQDGVVPRNATCKTDDVVVANAFQQVHLRLAAVVKTSIHCASPLVLQLLHDHHSGCVLQLNSVQYRRPDATNIDAADDFSITKVIKYILLIVNHRATTASIA